MNQRQIESFLAVAEIRKFYESGGAFVYFTTGCK